MDEVETRKTVKRFGHELREKEDIHCFYDIQFSCYANKSRKDLTRDHISMNVGQDLENLNPPFGFILGRRNNLDDRKGKVKQSFNFNGANE